MVTMGEPYKVQRKSGAVWRTVGKVRSRVGEAYDDFKSAVRNGQEGQAFRLQRGKRTIREEIAK